MSLKRVSLLLLILLVTCPAFAAERPRIGLALSGGGARGFAHIGVLKVLEQLRIPIHAIAGTSMGALAGGTYAAGVPVAEMERRITQVDWGRMFDDDPNRSIWPPRRKQADMRPTWDFTIGYSDGDFKIAKGLVEGQNVELFLTDLVKPSEGIERFDDLPIPFRSVATNLENGQMRVFDRGSLSQALRASMSVPGLFAPLETPEGLYVDGGLVRNLPVDIVRTLDVDVVIAVNLGSSYLDRDQLGTLLGVASQMIAILTEQNVEKSLRELDHSKDLLIIPMLEGFSSGNFGRATEAIARGEKATRDAAPKLARYSLSEPDYQAWRAERFKPAVAKPKKVDDIRIAGLEHTNPKLFVPLERKYEGKPLDRQALEQDLGTLYGRGDFEQLSYQFGREDGRNLLIVDAVEKSWGPGYLSFGIGFMTDYKGDTRFGGRAVYNRTWVNRLGAEWLTELTIGNESNFFTEFYQPIRLDRAGFIAPYLEIGEVPLSLFLEDRRIARFDVLSRQVGLDLGTTFGNKAELRLGTYLKRVRFDLDTGDPFLFQDSKIDESGLRARFLLDTLNSAYIPTAGNRLNLSITNPLGAMGADVEYTRIKARWDGAFSLREHSFVGSMMAGSSLNEEMPYYDQFPLGGFLKLSGYANEQFRGNDMAFASIVYYNRIATLPSPLGKGLYLGGSLESGKIWNSPGDGILNEEKLRFGSSLFFGADSIIGPFYVGFGLSGEGDTTVYVVLSKP